MIIYLMMTKEPLFLRRRRSSAARSERSKSLSIYPLASSSQFDQNFKSKLYNGRPPKNHASDIEEAGDDDEDHDLDLDIPGPSRQNVEFLREWRAQDGKRISVPVRIEPKVYFAAERTFLRWLQFSVIIGSIATVLLNFTKPGDTRGLISAIAFTVASLLSIAYSCGIFVYRAYRLRARHADGLYYDKFGPTILVVILFGALVTNLVLRWTE